MCGENRAFGRRPRDAAGSSPRVRGKRGRLVRSRLARGLIPACAGKTAYSPEWHCSLWAHPRVCGENLSLTIASCRQEGSSPRVRGKQAGDCRVFNDFGLIPACAGKTPRASHPCCGCRAHPRVCGENLTIFHNLVNGNGSSPRVRGKRDVSFLLPAVKGLIPACAGKTPAGRSQ